VPVNLVTIPGVPILRTGTYDLASGPRVFTEEDLVSAANALSTDAGVKAPRVKIDAVEQALGLDPTAHGGEPAFGWLDNLVVASGGQELLADWHVPEWVADAMQWAYPSLSIEGTPPGWTSSTGRSHELVITAVALLGTDWPGCTTLDDFREVLASGAIPDDETEADEAAVLATTRQRPTRVAASLDADLVERRFYERLDAGDLDTPDGVNPYDLWIRSRRFDDAGAPYLKVTDEGDGSLYRVDFTVSGSDVTFGAFVEVVEQDVPVAAGIARPAAPMAQWTSRENSRAAVRASTPTTGGNSTMNDAQRRAWATAYGLDPEAATEAEVTAAMEAGPPTAAEPESAPESAPETAPAPEAEPVAANLNLPAGTVLVSEQVWSDTNARLDRVEASAAARETEAATARRDGIITAAVQQGRIAPAERQFYRDMLDAPGGEEAATALIARLAPGRIPTPIASGAQVEVDASSAGDVDAEHEAFMRAKNPQAAARLAAAREPVPAGRVEYRQEV
jgi:hypothetical protein